MEEAKNARTVLRRAFTNSLTTLGQYLSDQPISKLEITVNFEILTEKSHELDAVNKIIFDFMVKGNETEDAISSEITAADNYKARYLRAKIEVSRVLNPPPDTQTQRQFRQISPPPASNESRRSFIFPKIELKKFSGDVREWLQFWSQFKKIHEDETIEKEDKFQYLMQAMVRDSRASELVNSFPSTAANYDKVISGLKNRFGKDELLVEVYVRELLELVLSNATKSNEKTPLSKIYDKLESHLRALESLGVTSDRCATILYPLVESSLPEELLRTWQRHSSTTIADVSKDRLTKLMEFLQAEVENEERIALAVGGFGTSSDKSKTKEERRFKKRGKSDSDAEIPTAAGLAALKENKAVSYIFCSGCHESAQCEKAREMTYESRQQAVKDKKVCFNCLKTGHSYKRCRYNQKCAWCGRKHVLIMCREVQHKQANLGQSRSEECEKGMEKVSLTTLLKNPEVFVQTLREKLRNEKTGVQTRAMALDILEKCDEIMGRTAIEVPHLTGLHDESLFSSATELNLGGEVTDAHMTKGNRRNSRLEHDDTMDIDEPESRDSIEQSILGGMDSIGRTARWVGIGCNAARNHGKLVLSGTGSELVDAG